METEGNRDGILEKRWARPWGSESTIEIDQRWVRGSRGPWAQRGPRRQELWHRGPGARGWVYRCRDRLFGEEMKLQIEPVSGDRHSAIGRDEL